METRRLRVVLPGGSGHVGHLLAQHFHSQGHAVTVLSRSLRPMPWRVVAWDGSGAGPGAWTDELAGADVCIHLSGRSVNCRYNAANRREIYDSRILTTRRLNEVIAEMANPPRLWLNASTATIYRHDLDHPMDETGELGGDEAGVPASWNFQPGWAGTGRAPSFRLQRLAREKSRCAARLCLAPTAAAFSRPC